MWTSFMYMIPVASVLAQARLLEEEKLRGDLQDELAKLVSKYAPSKAIRLDRNDEIDASIDTKYEKGTNLLIIFNEVMTALGLSMEIKITQNLTVCIMLTIRQEFGGIQDEDFNPES